MGKYRLYNATKRYTQQKLSIGKFLHLFDMTKIYLMGPYAHIVCKCINIKSIYRINENKIT